MKAGAGKAKLTHVLLMEDDSTIAHLIQLHLQNRGFSVALAEDGQKGLEMFDAGYYDILLVDLKMPKLSGLEVITQLKARGPLPPVLVISGFGNEETAVEVLKLGAMDYIVKDASSRFLEKLPVAINEVLKKHHDVEAARLATEERNRWLHELKQRVKELGCLYGIEKLFASEGESFDTVMQTVVNLIPQACKYAEISWARLQIRDREFRSERFENTRWRKAYLLKERGTLIGSLEVGYREKPPVPEHDLFSPEENELLHSISERLGHFIDRWRTEHQLQVTNEELRKLSLAVAQSATAVMITNVKGEIEYVNPRFTKMTGYTLAEIRGQNPRFLKSGERPAEEYAECWKTILGGGVWRGEFHNRRKDGELYWDFSTISPVKDDAGNVTHFVAVKEDITERKEAEQLQAGVLRLSALIAGCRTEDEICRVVVEGIRREMGVDRCGLFLGHPNQPPFRGTYGTDMQGHTADEHMHLWDIGKERDVEDLFKDGMFKTGFPLGKPEALPGEEGLSATLIALRQSGTVFGVISIDNRLSRRAVTSNQMVHIGLLAEVLGNALQAARAQQALGSSLEDLQRANEELEQFNRAMVGRENRIIEVKEEVNRLLEERGQPPRYEPVWNEPETAGDLQEQPET